MADKDRDNDPLGEDLDEYGRSVARKEERKVRARSGQDRNAWFWVGAFGMVGWSVAVPTLLGVVLGIWLDDRMQDKFSWTLAMTVAGLCVGLAIAWKWVRRESG